MFLNCSIYVIYTYHMRKRPFLSFIGFLVLLMALIPEIKAFSATTGMDVEKGISLSETTYITTSATDADIYEPDDTYDQASVIILNDPAAQFHNFHYAGDRDWIKFYALSGEVYSIEASNVTPDADVVIELYDTDGTTLLVTRDDGGKGIEELLEFISHSDGVYYVRVRNYDDSTELADNLAYELRVYNPIGNFAGYITGKVYDSSNNSPILDALISTDLGGSAISIAGGYYYMVVANGTYTITCSHEGYLDATVGGISVSGDIVERNILMTSTGTQTCIYSLLSTSQSFDSSGGTGTVSVKSPSGCSWTATSNTSWIIIDSGGSGNSDGTVNYSVLSNASENGRTGTITIAGETFTAIQLGVGASPVPDIKANGSDRSVTPIVDLSITVALDSGGSSGTPADWWILASTPYGLIYFSPSGWAFAASLLDIVPLQFPLVDFPSVEVLKIPAAVLPSILPGPYTFYFAIETTVNGVIDSVGLAFDSVTVVIP